MKITTEKKSSGAIDYSGPKDTFEIEAATITLDGAASISGDLVVTGTLVSALATVADPGTAGTIAPPASGADFQVNVTTVGASETRVMGTPTRIGQRAVIRHAVDGGDFAMTNASGWKGGGATDDVATFSEVEDTLFLVAVGTGAATDWRWTADKAVVFS